jgi:hypothetical protein
MAVGERVQTFRAACVESGVPFRSNDERVVFVVPKRNIETWLAYLRGQSVNEEDTYPKHTCESDCRQEVARLDELCREQRFPVAPPASLASSCDEFKRIADQCPS